MSNREAHRTSVAVIGAGPAGLTAAVELVRRGRAVTVLEATDAVGGISQTVERDGWRFDIGGHRFFTKVQRVEDWWTDMLGDEFLHRPRLSRILYADKLFDYPLRPLNALRNLGIVEAFRCVASYMFARIRPPRSQETFEGWVAARFGWRLYRMFFKTYTEKVWGVPAAEIQADWAAQRIKNLSLRTAVVHAVLPRKGQTDVTTLIDQFRYPRLGPGQMWERAQGVVVEGGGEVIKSAPVVAIHHRSGRATAVTCRIGHTNQRIGCDEVISSMPIGELAQAMHPAPPSHVLKAAAQLRHRDFLTVALVVPERAGFPDNWIYIHTPGVRVGRVQNFRSWSPHLVKPGRTCLGLEYFVSEGDDLWSMSDDDLVTFASAELGRLGLAEVGQVEQGFVVRVPKAYPVYDEDYRANVEIIADWLAATVTNVHPVGRNGMHRYNNQDHSMMTAMLTVENILDGVGHDIWAVNVEEEYHEGAPQKREATGSGRAAPLLPRPADLAADAS